MRGRWVAAGLFLAGAGLLALDQALPPPLDVLVSDVVTDRDGRPLRAFPIEDGRWRLPVALGEVDAGFLAALVAVEDKRFYAHGGVDGRAVLRALRDAIFTGEVRSGASTLTMQTARLLEPRPRSLRSKLTECLRAWQIERRLTKDEILALYLTLAPYGGNLEGVESAAWAYLGRSAAELTDAETALLIALPQAPEARRPDLRPETARSARIRVLDRLAGVGQITLARATEAASAPLPTRRHDFPAAAWHAAEWARVPGQGTQRTTLDGALQAEAERLVAALVATTPDDVQAAALVVDVGTRAVLASVGSARRDAPGGWLDLTDRRRSPGSTLKPFVYALAFEDGLATPDTLVADLPARLGSYAPENFDRNFRGEVTVADALRHSLNVPAVRVLDRVSAERFVGALSGAVDAAVPEGLRGGAGLATALGGLGLTARDLVVLYASLADGGIARPLRVTPSAPTSPGVRIVAAEAAAEVLAVLEGSPAPPGRMPAALTTGAPRVAYKTGTSYGYRDAWAAGVSGGLVAVVWVGRPDGAPRPGVTGREGALPTLFALFDASVPACAALPADQAPSPRPLARLARPTGPEILFPPDGAEVWAEPGRPLRLAARGRGVDWYEGGARIDAGDWFPPAAGFYVLNAVDADGRSSSTRVRVRGL